MKAMVRSYSDLVGTTIDCRVGVWDAMADKKMPSDYLCKEAHNRLPKARRYGILCRWSGVTAIGSGDHIEIRGTLEKVEADC